MRYFRFSSKILVKTGTFEKMTFLRWPLENLFLSNFSESKCKSILIFLNFSKNLLFVANRNFWPDIQTKGRFSSKNWCFKTWECEYVDVEISHGNKMSNFKKFTLQEYLLHLDWDQNLKNSKFPSDSNFVSIFEKPSLT